MIHSWPVIAILFGVQIIKGVWQAVSENRQKRRQVAAEWAWKNAKPITLISSQRIE